MTLQKSPGGSIFPYPYKGGELFGRLRKKLNLQLPMPIRFFDDPEVAKTWLVSET